MSQFTTFMICYGFVVGGLAGLFTLGSVKGGLGVAIASTLVGLVTGTVIDAQEVAAWKYEAISQVTDCRMRTPIASALADRKLTSGEYDALRSKEKAFDLDSARNEALGTDMAQCATTKGSAS
jgi:hypothetical protein